MSLKGRKSISNDNILKEVRKFNNPGCLGRTRSLKFHAKKSPSYTFKKILRFMWPAINIRYIAKIQAQWFLFFFP